MARGTYLSAILLDLHITIKCVTEVLIVMPRLSLLSGSLVWASAPIRRPTTAVRTHS